MQLGSVATMVHCAARQVSSLEDDLAQSARNPLPDFQGPRPARKHLQVLCVCVCVHACMAMMLAMLVHHAGRSAAVSTSTAVHCCRRAPPLGPGGGRRAGSRVACPQGAGLVFVKELV